MDVLREKNYQKQAENYAWRMAESISKVGLEQQCLIWQSLEQSSGQSFEYLNYPWDNSADCYQAFHKASVKQLQDMLKVVNDRLRNVGIGGDSQQFFWAIKDFLDAYLYFSQPARSQEYQNEFLSVLSQMREQTLKRILAPLIKDLPKVSKTKNVQQLFSALVSQDKVVETARLCSEEELTGFVDTLVARSKNTELNLEKADLKVLSLIQRLLNSVIVEKAYAA